jgi:thiol-disulfide isomerase/thioredoxin
MFAQIYAQLDAQMNKPGIGTTPELSGTTLEGKQINLDDYEGKVVLLDFWATWCGPCIAEMPNVKKVYEDYHDKGFEIIGISLDRSVEPLKEYIAENNIAWANIYDADQENSIADQFSITAIPSMFIVGKDGKIAAVNARGPELGKTVAELLGE